MKNFILIFILSAIIMLSSFTGLELKQYKLKTVVINPDSPMAHIVTTNYYQNAYIENSLRFADKAGIHLRKKVGRVLIEIGFLTNPAEEKYLTQKASQNYISSGIFRAFKEYKIELGSMN
jgi:N-acetylmuramoyl-L-alanine amidase